MSKAIVIIGTLDTKGPEVAYLRKCIEAKGHPVLVLDPGVLGQAAIQADITREEVARAAGVSLADLVAAGDKGRAIGTMIAGTRAIIARLYGAGRIAGVLAVGGGQGTAIGTSAMQVLPVGTPKLMLSTVVSGRSVFEPYVGTTDMTLMHSVADIVGVNVITRKVFQNAAGAIVGMVEGGTAGEPGTRTVIGATMLGLTTPCVLRARELLEEYGYEVVTFHANGTGGRCMERLVDEGVIRGVLDLSTQELTGHVCNGLFDGGPQRMVSAGRRGLPQVVAPGGTDYIVLGPLDSLSEEHRRRPLLIHNPNITLVRTSGQEMAQVGSLMARRLNESRGATTVLIPMRGLSYSNRPGHVLYDPEADRALFTALRAELHPGIEIQEIDAHINDPGFAKVAAERMHARMAA